METDEFCPLREDCTVCRNNIHHNLIAGMTYRNLYCLQVNSKYKSCRRYQASTRLGRPVHRLILPDSSVSLEEATGVMA